jgi:hypothetical protein
MLSSRASSGRKPWVAAEPIVSSLPSRSRARNPAITSPSSARNAPRRRCRRSRQNSTSGSSALSPVAASDAGASSQAVSRWAMNASISSTKAGLASWLASTGVTPSVTGAGIRSAWSDCSDSIRGR